MQFKLSKPAHKDITRMDYGSIRGWNVRVNFEGKRFCKLFSDKKHGGKNCALLAAISHRDDLRAKLGKPITSQRIVTVASNSTGVVGVYLDKKKNRYDVYWVNAVGVAGHSSFSIAKHGHKKAFKLAIIKREQKNMERCVALGG